MGGNLPRVRQITEGVLDDGDEMLVFTRAQLGAFIDQCIMEKIRANALCNPQQCGGHGGGGEGCTIDTRLSLQRKRNLMRLGTDMYVFDTQMPLSPGQSKEWKVPAYPLGRVIENLYFRPEMADGGKPDQIQVQILGEDGVPWAKFSGGRHMINACCLLEFFQEDCIGWGEGFTFKLTHTGALGQPNMIGANSDWNYLFPGQKSSVRPNWCWPKGCS